MLLTVFINGERGISVVRALLKEKRVIKFVVCLKSLEKNILRKIKIQPSVLFWQNYENYFLNKIIRSKIDLIIVIILRFLVNVIESKSDSKLQLGSSF